jgi:hypothetical protein
MDKSLIHDPKPFSLPTEIISSTWNPVSVAKDSDILSLFQCMYNKMRFSLPDDPNLASLDHCIMDPLSRIAYFQRNVVRGFTRRLNEHITMLNNSDNTNSYAKNTNAVVLRENWIAPPTDYARQRHERARMPFMQNLHFSSMNFDSIAPPENSMPPDGTFEDWLWNAPTADMDEFAIPPL